MSSYKIIYFEVIPAKNKYPKMQRIAETEINAKSIERAIKKLKTENPYVKIEIINICQKGVNV